MPPRQPSTFKFSSALTHSGHASSKRMRPPLSGLASQRPTTNHAACVCPKYLFHFLCLSPGILSSSSSNLSFSIHLLTSVSVHIKPNTEKRRTRYAVSHIKLTYCILLTFIINTFGGGKKSSLHQSKALPSAIFTDT